MTVATQEAVPREMVWDIKVPYHKMRLALIQIGLCIGLPFGAVVVFLLYHYTVNGEQGALFGALMILTMFALLPPVMWLIYGGTYDLCIAMTDKGIVCENHPQQANRTRWVARITILLQMLSKQPSYGAISAAHNSTSRIRTDIAWDNIKSVACNPKTREIVIREKRHLRQTVLYCTEGNYQAAVRYMADRLPSLTIKG